MSGDNWNFERVKLKPIHRRIENRCRDILKEMGRTWRRLTMHDREQVLVKAIQGMRPEDVYRWSTRYSVGDVLNAVTTPTPGAHATARVGRAGNED